MNKELFLNRYKTQSIRANWHDYKGGNYFVTICTKSRKQYFGKIINYKMILTEIGEYLHEQIIKTPEMRPDMNLEIPLFVIMPDHVHLIVSIGNNQYNCGDKIHNNCGGAMHCASTTTIESLNKISPQSKNLASIIRGIKISTTTYARKQGIPFAWQTRFHDHIIRNTNEMNRIAKYIKENVTKWGVSEWI